MEMHPYTGDYTGQRKIEYLISRTISSRLIH